MFLEDFKINSNLTKDKFNVNICYNYWKNTLFEYCMKLFSWKNLPSELPQKEIEMRLILYGMCGFNKDKNGDFIATNISLNGVTHYWDVFENYIWTTPLESGQCAIGKDGVEIDNNSLKNSLYRKIHHYATMLAHNEVSLVCNFVNGRSNVAIKCINEKSADTAKIFRKKQFNGDLDCLVDKGFSQMEFEDMATNNSVSIRELIESRNDILNSFLEDIGVRRQNQKKERVVVDEVSSDSVLLKFNIQDMYDSRIKAVEQINNIFNLKIECECNVDLNYNGKNDNVNRGDINDD